MQGTQCKPATLSERHHRRHALYGEGLAGGTAGDAAAQMETQTSGSYHYQGTTIVPLPQNDNEVVSKVPDTTSFSFFMKQSPDFPKPGLCHVPDFLYLWTLFQRYGKVTI